MQDITIHVPETGGQRDASRKFLKASEIGPYTDDGTGATYYPVYDDATGALEKTVATAREGLKGFTDLLTGDMESDQNRIEADIHTAITMVPTNAENPVHVAALINIVTARQADLKQNFQEEELTAHPDDVKRIQQQLTEVSRLRSVLETHMNNLAAEASGEKELENISRSQVPPALDCQASNISSFSLQ